VDYFMPDYCPECHGTLASDGQHLFSVSYCSMFIAEDDGMESVETPKETRMSTSDGRLLRGE
jgi:hypothetical protein